MYIANVVTLIIDFLSMNCPVIGVEAVIDVQWDNNGIGKLLFYIIPSFFHRNDIFT